jgi:sortase A
MVTGLVLALGTGWSWSSQVLRFEANQTSLARQVQADWGRAESGPGAPIARLHLPTLQLNLLVVEGVAEADLNRGPGHITGTPQFGEPGNVGVAGHRLPGAFWDLDLLRVNDPVVVENAQRWYVYRVVRELVVGPDDRQVLAAPNGTEQFLTLVTCDPIFSTARRLIRQAVLVRSQPHDGAAPAELSQV